MFEVVLVMVVLFLVPYSTLFEGYCIWVRSREIIFEYNTWKSTCINTVPGYSIRAGTLLRGVLYLVALLRENFGIQYPGIMYRRIR